MKITGTKTHVLQAHFGDRAFGWSQRVGDRRQTAICVVETDAGIVGYGEAFYFGGPSTIVAPMMEQAFGPLIAGADPRSTPACCGTSRARRWACRSTSYSPSTATANSTSRPPSRWRRLWNRCA